MQCQGLQLEPRAGRSSLSLLCYSFNAAKISSWKEQGWFGEPERQGHPAPCSHVEIHHDSCICSHHPLAPAPFTSLVHWHQPGPGPKDMFYAARDGGGGGQGKQNKHLLPGTCSLPQNKKNANSTLFESIDFPD